MNNTWYFQPITDEIKENNEEKYVRQARVWKVWLALIWLRGKVLLLPPLSPPPARQGEASILTTCGQQESLVLVLLFVLWWRGVFCAAALHFLTVRGWIHEGSKFLRCHEWGQECVGAAQPREWVRWDAVFSYRFAILFNEWCGIWVDVAWVLNLLLVLSNHTILFAFPMN